MCTTKFANVRPVESRDLSCFRPPASRFVIGRRDAACGSALREVVVRLTDLLLSRGEAPHASGRAARRLPQRTSRLRAAPASGVTRCISGGKRGFSPEPANGPPSAAVRS